MDTVASVRPRDAHLIRTLMAQDLPRDPLLAARLETLPPMVPVKVPLLAYLGTLDISCDFAELDDSSFSVVNLVTTKIGDDAFYELLAALEAEGQKDPVGYNVVTGYAGRVYLEQANGHHRLLAALILGWETIAVVRHEGEDVFSSLSGEHSWTPDASPEYELSQDAWSTLEALWPLGCTD